MSFLCLGRLSDYLFVSSRYMAMLDGQVESIYRPPIKGRDPKLLRTQLGANAATPKAE
jgi:hypothetical protein